MATDLQQVHACPFFSVGALFDDDLSELMSAHLISGKVLCRLEAEESNSACDTDYICRERSIYPPEI